MVQYILMFGTVVFIGMSIGSQPILSYNYGAGQIERIRGTLIKLLISSVLLSLFFFTILRWQAASLVVLFIPGHPEAAAVTLRAAEIISWSLLIMPVGIIGSMFFTALERAGSSMLVALSRGLVFTVIGLLVFPPLWGETGIWITPIFSESVTIFLTAYLLYRWFAQADSAVIRKSAEALPVKCS
jgi:Na+-driven multidrug efflux pump